MAKAATATRRKKQPVDDVDTLPAFDPQTSETQPSADSPQLAPEQVAPVQVAPELLEAVLAALSSQLRVSVQDGDFTDPNRRTLKLFLGKTCVSSTSFDVTTRREYEG